MSPPPRRAAPTAPATSGRSSAPNSTARSSRGGGTSGCPTTAVSARVPPTAAPACVALRWAPSLGDLFATLTSHFAVLITILQKRCQIHLKKNLQYPQQGTTVVVVLRFFHPFPLRRYVFKQSLGQASAVLSLLLFGLLRKHSSRGRRHGGGPGGGGVGGGEWSWCPSLGKLQAGLQGAWCGKGSFTQSLWGRSPALGNFEEGVGSLIFRAIQFKKTNKQKTLTCVYLKHFR